MTFVTTSRRWTLGIRRLSRSVMTAMFSVQSGVQRPSGSGVSRRWTLGIRRLSRSDVTAVFPGKSGVQRPSSLHPEGELSKSVVSFKAWWQPFSPFSPAGNDVRHCIQKVNFRDQASLSKWSNSQFFPFSPECNDLRHCIQKVNSRDLASLSKRSNSQFFPVQSGV